MPSITIIVPVYNVEQYLPRCVDSILAQTFTDFELILVDDGSPDGCGLICDEYAKKDARVCVIHQENGGLSAARNAGLDWAFANSDSEWIGFVDSDDWIHPRMYEILYRIATENGVKIGICDFQRTDGVTTEPVDPASAAATFDGLDFFCSDHNVSAVIAVNKLYRKELFDGVRYPVGKIHEDEFVTYKLLHRAGMIAYSDAKLYYYYQNDASITLRPYNTKRLDAVKAREEQMHFAKEQGSKKLVAYVANVSLSVLQYNYYNLLSINEPERAKELKQKGRKLIWNECREYLWHPFQYGYLIEPFYPLIGKTAARLKNLKSMLQTKSLDEIVRYYRSK